MLTLPLCFTLLYGPCLRGHFQSPAILRTGLPNGPHGGGKSLYQRRVGGAGLAPFLVGVTPHPIQLLGPVLTQDERLLPLPEQPPPPARVVGAAGVQLRSHVV